MKARRLAHSLNKCSCTLAICLAQLSSYAQKADTPILRIGNDVSTYGEFKHMYGENDGTTLTPVSQAEYMELFVAYKLKAAEARDRGIDTTDSYKKELKYYIDELSSQYLRDTTADRKAILKLQERLKQEVKAEHILIHVRPDASPADSLDAFKKAKQARDRVINGEDFAKVAKEVSEDPSARSNGGDLGYFSAMQMVQPFEDYAYKTPVGSCSEIFRTQFGFHFIHVSDFRKTQGEVVIAHFMAYAPANATDLAKQNAKAKCDSIYSALLAGADFANAAKTASDDQQTASQGGLLPWLSPSKLRKEFADAISNLEKIGDITKPIHSPAGWHIFKLIDRRDAMPAEEIEQAYNMMKRRSPEMQNSDVKAKARQLKAEYGFTWDKPAKDSIVNIFLTSKDNDEQADRLNKLPDIVATTKDGHSFSHKDIIAKTGRWNRQALPSDNIEAIAEDLILDYEKSKLADKYPDFKYSCKEYTEGLLVFEITSKDVWGAEPDSATIKRMYENNKPRYSRQGFFEGDIFFCSSQKEAAKVAKLVAKGNIDKAKKTASQTISGKQTQGGNYDDIIWPNDKPNKFVVLNGKRVDGTPLSLRNATSAITTDFQQRKEAELIEKLKAKFKPVILKKIE